MKKRIFGVLIAMCILIGVAPFRVAAVEEQFSLQVGETYYFDLTGECKNDGMIPYSGYIPFTYVGTIDAYVIKGTQSSHNSQTEAENNNRHCGRSRRSVACRHTFRHRIRSAETQKAVLKSF